MTDMLTTHVPMPTPATTGPAGAHHDEAARPAQAPVLDRLDGPLLCIAVTEETHDVRSLTFAAPDGVPLAFEAGQYLTIGLDVAGEWTERCYTISSCPTEGRELTVTVKRVSDGPVSNLLHDTVRVGDAVWARGPLGEFGTGYDAGRPALLLSAGSGITPVMSMLRWGCAGPTAGAPDVAFVHSARTPVDVAFRQELEDLGDRAGVDVTIVCEDDAPEEAWDGPRGRLTPGLLLSRVPDLFEREVYTCGPPGYMAAVREMLALLGVDPARCHEESFEIGGGSPAPDAAPVGTSHRVEFRRSGVVVDCDEATPLLTAAAGAGLVLPSSCAEGVCGTCRSGLLSGQVDMQHAGGIRQREIDEGAILLCCSTPRDDVVVDA